MIRRANQRTLLQPREDRNEHHDTLGHGKTEAAALPAYPDRPGLWVVAFINRVGRGL